MRINRRCLHGQTLFELSITLIIIGLMCTMAIPLFNDMRERSNARAAISRMASATYHARMLALTQRRNITLCPSLSPPDCSNNWTDPLIIFSEDPTESGGKIDIKGRFPALKKGSIQWRSFRKSNAIKMQSNGMTLSYNGTFIYCPDNRDPRYAKALVINKTGRSRLAQDLNQDGIIDISQSESISCIPK